MRRSDRGTLTKKTRRQARRPWRQGIRTGLLLLVTAGWLQGPGPRADVFEDAMRATVRVAAGDTSGTAFVVEAPGKETSSPSYLLVTAAHAFEQMHGDTCQIVFRRQGDDGHFLRHEIAAPIRKEGQPMWSRHAEADVAILPIERPAEADLNPFPVSQVATEAFAADGRVHVGQDVCVPGFPAQLESNPAGWPVLRRGSIASHPLAPLSQAKTFMVDVASFGGESGAPVVARIDGRATVVGVISSMQRQTDKTTMPFEERTMHTPLDLGIAVPSAFIHQLMKEEGGAHGRE